MSPRAAWTVRPAQESEENRIRLAIRQARLNPLALDWRRFLIAVDRRGRFLGCGQVKPHADGSLELASLAIEPAWQGKGIGTEIVRRLLAPSAPPVWLTCRSALQGYYQRMGFVTVAPQEPQPPYFARIRRLAKAFSLFSASGESLAVMVWRGP